VLGKRIIPQRDSTISVWTEDQWTHKGPILWEKVSEANRNKWIRSTPCSHLPATTNAKLLRRVAKLLEITIYRFPLVYSGTSWICLPMGETTWTCHLLQGPAIFIHGDIYVKPTHPENGRPQQLNGNKFGGFRKWLCIPKSSSH
jgi:hypothetical protein